MRTITLELLRHGPAHNQLLSPLTEYLALCENHSAVSLRVPFEHNQMYYRLRALSYFLGQESRSFQLADTARVMGEMLGGIPGLTADLSRQGPSTRCQGEAITHLRLILSSSELALLPFELALAPNGFPGAGQYLSLQPQTPICITRETRRHPGQFLEWPTRPKILFVFASPPGFESVPAAAHLLALRQALGPWLSFSNDIDDQKNDEQDEDLVARHIDEVKKRLGVLPYATVAMLEEACASGEYTHIHILAHGAKLETEYDTRYGLAFHAAGEDGVELVSGDRLATILNTRNANSECNRLAVVTLASCNSGNVGSVAGVGASISHALHESGIPLVIGSQFPLSFGGSVMMVEKLYNGLLWGKDPRELLVDLRRSLHAHYTETHDWASLTAYSSLPHNFEAQLVNISITQAGRAINAALSQADNVLKRFLPPENTGGKDKREINEPPQTDPRAEAALEHIEKSQQHLLTLLAQHPDQREQIQAKLAGVQKRLAQLQFHSNKPIDAICNSMQKSRKYYWETRFLEPTEAYKTVQYLSLTLVLQAMGKLLPSDLRSERNLSQLWLSAEIQALSACDTGSDSNRSWAYCDLAELYLMAPLIQGLTQLHVKLHPQDQADSPLNHFANKAIHSASQITCLISRSSYQNFSTRRQIARYSVWFLPMIQTYAAAHASPDLDKDTRSYIETTAERMLQAMPPGEEPDWDQKL